MNADRTPSLKERNFLLVLIVGYGAWWGWLAVSPLNRSDWLLENLLVIACTGLLAATYRRFRLTRSSYVLLALFLALHTYGAHISYGSTPMDPWLQSLFGEGRMPYDRLVHFTYGLLLTYPIREALARLTGVKGWPALAFTLSAVLATGAFYELIEMWVAHLAAPELGLLFVGSQGDPWDTHRDMELELYGSLLALGLYAAFQRAILVSGLKR